MRTWLHGCIVVTSSLAMLLTGCSGEGAEAEGSSSMGAGGTAEGGEGGTAGAGGSAEGGAAGTAGAAGSAQGGGSSGAGAGGSAQGGAASSTQGCPRKPGPDDFTRKVVVSHLFDEDAQKSSLYEVLDLSTSGQLSKTGKTFQMGRGEQVPITFTPDGKIGIAVQDDGSLGVFRFDDHGEVHVIHERFKGSFYATRVQMASDGTRVYVLSTQWVEHGGGVYVVSIGCDGTLTDEGKLFEAKLPFALRLLPGTKSKALVASQDVLGSSPEQVGHIIDLDAGKRIASTSVFGDAEAFVGSLALTADGSLGLFGDTSSYNSTPDRVGVVRMDGTGLQPLQVIDVEDPCSIEVSPFDDMALVVSGFGDAIFVLDYDKTNSSAPYSLRGKLEYHGDHPKVPGDSVQITRGSLAGLVLLSDYTGVRMVRFRQSGSGIEDLGRFEIGTGTESLTGAVGVQP